MKTSLILVAAGVLLCAGGRSMYASGGPCTVHVALGGMALFACGLCGLAAGAFGLAGVAWGALKSRAAKRRP